MLAALLIGLLGGLIGLILGSLRMPALIRWLGQEPARAIGTNLVVGIAVGAAGLLGHLPGGVDWTLSKASVVTGNESYNVHATQDSHSLYLPAGSSATTRAHCVGLSKPAMRFFARSANTGLLSSLKVEVLVESSLGLTLSVPIGSARLVVTNVPPDDRLSV